MFMYMNDTALIGLRVPTALKIAAQRVLIGTGTSLQEVLGPVVVDALTAVVSGAEADASGSHRRAEPSKSRQVRTVPEQKHANGTERRR